MKKTPKNCGKCKFAQIETIVLFPNISSRINPTRKRIFCEVKNRIVNDFAFAGYWPNCQVNWDEVKE